MYKIHRDGNFFYFTAYPILTDQIPNTFTGNTAALSGGAIYWGIANAEIFIMPGTLFINNTVTAIDGSGGAMFLEKSNRLIYMYSSVFVDNEAYQGGALALSQSNYPMSMYLCSFTGNCASGYGGAVYLGDGNGYGFFKIFTTSVIRFLGAVFSKNTALIGGGGVYSSNSNAVMFNDTVMVSNYANISGGAIHFESQNIARLSRVTLLNNVAGLYGGAIQSHIANRIAFHNLSLFTENSAGLDGGAVAMTLGSIISFDGETSFTTNNASRDGGAIYSSASILGLGAVAINFTLNSASRGSALRLEEIVVNSVRISPSNESIVFSQNVCSGRGGTVSWIKDPASTGGTFAASANSTSSRVVYRNNVAAFGSNSSTQATSLKYAGYDPSTVTRYFSALLPLPTVLLLDYYSAQDFSDSTTTVTVSVASSSCLGHVGYLSGITTTVAERGSAKFANLTAFCFPGGSMTLTYTG